MACTSCGFERIEEGKSCPLCGAETLNETVERDSDDTMQQHRPPRRPAPVAAGELFAGRYEVVTALGRGGMGTVYRVRDTATAAECALKILHANATETDAAARFRREIEILSRIDHPAVVRITDWGIAGDRMYFASELVDGEDLRQHLRKRIVLPAREVADVGGRLAEALAVAHRHGIVHRDIKPHNVMICRDGTLKLLDFGIARGVGIDLNTVTTSGVMIGTPEYMSPEQFEGQRVDGRSDIYSLGVVLYELTSGVLPFQADTPVALGIQHQTIPPPPIRGQRPEVPAWLERIILKCLRKDRGSRYLTAEELAVDLLRLRAGRKQVRTLPTGDRVIEDDSESEPWALTIHTTRERRSWTREMAMLFEERYYLLEDIGYSQAGGEHWIYRFLHWPPERIFRKIVDYAQDTPPPDPGLGAKLRNWFS